MNDGRALAMPLHILAVLGNTRVHQHSLPEKAQLATQSIRMGVPRLIIRPNGSNVRKQPMTLRPSQHAETARQQQATTHYVSNRSSWQLHTQPLGVSLQIIKCRGNAESGVIKERNFPIGMRHGAQPAYSLGQRFAPER